MIVESDQTMQKFKQSLFYYEITYQYQYYIFRLPLTKMYQKAEQNLNQQITKCRSLQSLHLHNKVSKRLAGFRTRPKFEYIPNKQLNKNLTQQCLNQNLHQIQQSISPMLGRIKSVDQLSKMKQTASFENIVGLYKKENDNLKSQNKFLLKQIRKKQKNEEILNNYIAQLRKQIRNLQKSNKLSPQSTTSRRVSSTKISRQQNDNKIVTLQNVYSKPGVVIDQGDTWNTMYQIDELNQRFNALMQQCSKQSCPRTRNMLRSKLAQTAQRMKGFKKQFSLLC